MGSTNVAAGFSAKPASSHNSAENTPSLSTQKSPFASCRSSTQSSDVNFRPNDVNMNEVYISDDDEDLAMDQTATHPTSVPDSVFSRTLPAPVSCPSEPVPSYPASTSGNVSQAAVSAVASFGPPGFQPSFQQPSGAAIGSGIPPDVSAGRLAQMENVLKENPVLTEQVMALIVQQYPLYAANPLMLRFATFNELQLLKKLREERGSSRPAALSAPSTTYGSIAVTTVGGQSCMH